uniref:ATPase_AAA_core domain-containing protein n=1 Tax=Hydatigena taeniaeformis TaxID=6205 RepID=A0A0R3WYG3_HYDTA
LGCETLVHFLAVTSPSGKEADESFSAKQWMAKHPFTFTTDRYDQNEFIDFHSFSFCNVESDRTVYKVIPTQADKRIIIFIASTMKLVVDFIRQFSLSTKFIPEVVEPTGLLLYGLQGCGKSRVLEVVSRADVACDDVLVFKCYVIY